MTKRYEDVAANIGRLVERKNTAYGDSFTKTGEVLKIIYPNGVKSEDYETLLVITRILDKIFRIATDENAFSEEPWKDIAGYAILMAGAE